MDKAIGVFDSGIGGLSILNSLVENYHMKILFIYLIIRIALMGINLKNKS